MSFERCFCGKKAEFRNRGKKVCRSCALKMCVDPMTADPIDEKIDTFDMFIIVAVNECDVEGEL
jgi:hypothetical protein